MRSSQGYLRRSFGPSPAPQSDPLDVPGTRIESHGTNTVSSCWGVEIQSRVADLLDLRGQGILRFSDVFEFADFSDLAKLVEVGWCLSGDPRVCSGAWNEVLLRPYGVTLASPKVRKTPDDMEIVIVTA